MKKKGIGILVFMLLIATILSVQGNEESLPMSGIDSIDWWPMHRHDAANSGYSTSKAPDKCTINWSKELGYDVTSHVVINGKIYIGDNYHHDRAVRCFSAETGEHEWTFHTGNRRIKSSPAVYNEKVYICTYRGEGKMHCLHAINGTEIWNYTTSEDIQSSPAIYNDNVYFGSKNGHIYCLNAINGDCIWQHYAYGCGSSPAVYDGKVYVASTFNYPGRVKCLDAYGNGDETTDLIWEYITFDDWFASPTPVANDGKVYITSVADKMLYCFNALNGTPIWIKTFENDPCTPAIAYNKVYVGSVNTAYCLNTSTGVERWNSILDGRITPSGPSIADGKVYFVTSRPPGIYCLNASNGRILWSYITNGNYLTSPAIANGKIYVDVHHIGGQDIFHCFGGENHPPQRPLIPLGPPGGEVGVEYLFSTGSSDFDTNDIQYGWDWDGDGVIEDNDWTEFYSSGEFIDISHSWSTEGIFEVRVKARDIYNGTSDWSNPLTVTITPQIPELEIGNITCGRFGLPFGVGISAEILNVGDVDACDVEWSISFDGGLILVPSGGYVGGTIDVIFAGEQTEVRTGLVFGFGQTVVTVDVEVPGLMSESKSSNAVVLLSFVSLN